MKTSLQTIARGALAGCLVLAGLIFVIRLAPTASSSPSIEEFTGQIAEVRVTSIPAEAGFRFSTSSPAPKDAGSVAAPRLVGMAGRSAYLRGASGETERVSVGDELDGWSVARIGEKSVTLTNGARSEQLKMFQ